MLGGAWQRLSRQSLWGVGVPIIKKSGLLEKSRKVLQFICFGNNSRSYRLNTVRTAPRNRWTVGEGVGEWSSPKGMV